MIALALIVKGSDKEAESLNTCLQNVSPYVDGIFITITQKNEKVEGVAKNYNAIISHFEWCNDFSKARNYNFSQVPIEYDYILWCDADDAFRGLENLTGVIKQHPADAYSMNYLYAFDEWNNPIVVHPKTQIVKNDGCVKWEGSLHEDFSPTRELKTYFIKDIERLHLTDEERVNENKQRNLDVALHQSKEHPDDPRSYWNLGNSYKGLMMDAEALRAFDTFLQHSQSDDEKYIVRLRRAESLWALGKKDKAIDEARYAIGLKPQYPDAYHLAGSLLFEMKQFEKARDMYLTGLMKKPPYYKIIVYNPRDYDYVPMMNLAKTYFALHLPQLSLPLMEGCLKICPKDENLKGLVKTMKKESVKADKIMALSVELKKIKDKKKLKIEIDKIPDEFKSHPAICNIRNTNFIKEESSGKDLVIFCGYTEEEWTPETAKTKGIGGSEEAVIWLSKGLVERGWNVTVYNNCGHKQRVFDGVTFAPFWMWNYRDKQDVMILWRSPKLVDYDINTEKLFIDLHDVISPGEFTDKRLEKIDKVFVKSQFHKSLFPNIPDEKIVVVPNGIDYNLFSGKTKKNKYLLLNTSSPDRSLRALIDGFYKVKQQVPEAECIWAYGWGVFDIVHGSDRKAMEWKEKIQQDMKDVGIKELGRVSHGDVAELYLKAGVFAYPSEFSEIDCISLSKAMAAGAVPVTTDFSAMGEKKIGGGIFIHSDKTKDNWCKPYQFDFSLEDEKKKQEWVDAVVKVLREGYDVEEMRVWAKKYNWTNIIDVWNKYLS